MNSCSLAALVGGADKNFLVGDAIGTSRLQQQRQQTESAQCLLPLRVACSQRHYATADDSRVLPAVHWLSQSTFFFCFYGHFSTEKRKKTKMRMSFSAEK